MSAIYNRFVKLDNFAQPAAKINFGGVDKIYTAPGALLSIFMYSFLIYVAIYSFLQMIYFNWYEVQVYRVEQSRSQLQQVRINMQEKDLDMNIGLF